MMNFTIIFIFIALYDYQLFDLLIPQLLDTNQQVVSVPVVMRRIALFSNPEDDGFIRAEGQIRTFRSDSYVFPCGLLSVVIDWCPC